MKKNIVKRSIPVALAVLVFTGVGLKADYDSENKSVYAETVFQAKIESETQELENIKSVESSDLEISEELSSEESILYEDTDNNLYEIQNEEVTGFLNLEEEADSPKLSEKQIEAMAEEYLNTLAEADKYELYKEKYNKYMETYRYYYYYYIGEYKTADVVYIEIDKYGNLRSFAKPQEGEFDNANIKILPKDEIVKKAVEMSNYNTEEFDVQAADIMIAKEEGSIKYCVYLICKEHGSDMVYTDVVYIEAEG